VREAVKYKKDVEHHPPQLHQCLLAELLGTFALTFADAGAAIVGENSGEIGRTAQAVIPGLLVMAMIFAIGNVSGAQINPAVTLSFALRGVFPWARVPAYWSAQVLGAVVATAVLMGLLGTVDQGVSQPHGPMVPAFSMEFLLSFILIFVILSTATRAQIIGPNAAFPVGATIALCGLIGKPISGASMNPARSLGPALVSGQMEFLWLYLLAPPIGGMLSVLVVWILQGPPKSQEVEAAQGKG
jgi:MIP family channel proteins